MWSSTALGPRHDGGDTCRDRGDSPALSLDGGVAILHRSCDHGYLYRRPLLVAQPVADGGIRGRAAADRQLADRASAVRTDPALSRRPNLLRKRRAPPDAAPPAH